MKHSELFSVIAVVIGVVALYAFLWVPIIFLPARRDVEWREFAKAHHASRETQE